MSVKSGDGGLRFNRSGGGPGSSFALKINDLKKMVAGGADGSFEDTSHWNLIKEYLENSNWNKWPAAFMNPKFDYELEDWPNGNQAWSNEQMAKAKKIVQIFKVLFGLADHKFAEGYTHVADEQYRLLDCSNMCHLVCYLFKVFIIYCLHREN